MIQVILDLLCNQSMYSRDSKICWKPTGHGWVGEGGRKGRIVCGCLNGNKAPFVLDFKDVDVNKTCWLVQCVRDRACHPGFHNSACDGRPMIGTTLAH